MSRAPSCAGGAIREAGAVYTGETAWLSLHLSSTCLWHVDRGPSRLGQPAGPLDARFLIEQVGQSALPLDARFPADHSRLVSRWRSPRFLSRRPIGPGFHLLVLLPSLA